MLKLKVTLEFLKKKRLWSNVVGPIYVALKEVNSSRLL